LERNPLESAFPLLCNSQPGAAMQGQCKAAQGGHGLAAGHFSSEISTHFIHFLSVSLVFTATVRHGRKQVFPPCWQEKQSTPSGNRWFAFLIQYNQANVPAANRLYFSFLVKSNPAPYTL
jgi:hypothetical protein